MLNRSGWVAIALCCSFTAQAADSQKAEKKLSGAELRNYLMGIRFTGEVPALTGFSPMKPVAGIPVKQDGVGHSTPYKTAAGCVAYFYPPDGKATDFQMKWKGSKKCDGKPVEGEGQLQIYRKTVGSDAQILVSVYEGTFKDGALTGSGMKGNFTYGVDGKPLQDVHIFQGEFANGVLNGRGEARWTGPADAKPSAWVKAAEFKDGTPVNGMALGRVHPVDGVDADLAKLYVNKDGDIYTYQASRNGGKPIEGSLFFTGDPAEWVAEIYSYDFLPQMAQLTRNEVGKRGSMLVVLCERFEFTQAAIACPSGSLASVSSGLGLGLQKARFSVPLPYRSSRIPFRLMQTEKVTVGMLNEAHPMSCNADMSLCSGDDQFFDMKNTDYYWYGKAELRNGVHRLLNGKLYEQKQISGRNPSDDKVVAECRRFSEATVCREGTIYQNNSRISGSFRLKNVTFESDVFGEESYVAGNPFGVIAEGWSRLTFKNGSWAQVRMDDGELTDVGDCDVPSEEGKYTCSLSGNTVNFHGVRRSRTRPDADEVIPVEPLQWPQAAPPRFVPTPAPQRPVIVLPGMR